MRARGISLIEFVVVVICIGILAGLLLERVLPLIGLAEQTAFDRTRGELASALLLAAAERVVRGESASLIELDGSNPMELLLTTPGNYVGSSHGVSHDVMPSRSWYFDESRGVLFYRWGAIARRSSADDHADRAAFRVRFVFRDRDGNERFDPAHDRFDGLRLESAE